MSTNEDFLHGVEVVELQEGARPIFLQRSAVIGLIGTAEDSEDAVAASYSMGSAAADNDLAFTALAAGVAGNNIGVYMHAIEPSQALTVTVNQFVIKVALATDADRIVTSTAADVKAAIDANADASELVTVSHSGDGAGLAGVTYGYRYLSGGLDEAFPLNTPVLVPGRRSYAARLGSIGTLPKAIDGIFDHAQTWVVVVRVAEGVDDDATKSNIIGSDTLYTGIHAFMNSESVTQVAPRILIAPEWSDEAEVATELDGVAQHLIAISIIEGPNTTDVEALAYRQKFDSERMYIIDPQVQIWDTNLNTYRFEGASSRVAGVFAENDLKNGWWTSPSNHPIRGIVGLKRPIDFDLSNPYSRSNYLNGGNVNVIIQKDGYRLWGNHTVASDPRWRFISVRRTADMIHEALLRSHLWAVDRNITKFYLEEVMASVQRWMDQQVRLDHIAGGSIWVDPEINTIESLASGRVYFDIEFTPYPPAERITFRSHLTNKYLADIFPEAA